MAKAKRAKTKRRRKYAQKESRSVANILDCGAINFVAQIVQQMQALEPYMTALPPVGDGEFAIGTVSPVVVKMHSYWQATCSRIVEMQNEMEEQAVSERRYALIGDLRRAHAIQQFVELFITAQLHFELGTHVLPELYLRAGRDGTVFVVVTEKNQQEHEKIIAACMGDLEVPRQPTCH